MPIAKLLIGALIFLPFIVAGGVIVSQGVPDALWDGDGALLEIATKAALDGEQLTGPYSRGGFNHPGPAYFYLLAPFYWLTKGRAMSLTVTVLLLNLLSLAGILAIIGRYTARWAYLWCALLLAYYIRDWGPIIFLNIWNPYVTILAFIFAILSLAAVAVGKSRCLPMAVGAASFVVQTHLGYTLALAVTAIGALVLWGLPGLRRMVGITSTARGKARTVLLVTGMILVIFWILPVCEQFSASPGNLTKIFHFFSASRSEHSWREIYHTAWGIWANYGRAVLTHTHSGEQFWTASMSDKPFFLQEPVPLLSHLIVWGQGLLLGVAYVIARRRRQDYFVALTLLCGALYLATGLSLKRIVGPLLDYLLIWMSSLGVLTWFVVGGVCLPAVKRKIGLAPQKPWQWLTLGATVLLVGGLTMNSVRSFGKVSQDLVTNRLKGTYTRDLDQIGAKLLSFLQQQGAANCVLRLLDRPVWPALAGLALQLTKSGLTVTVDPQWPTKYPARYTSTALPAGVFLLCAPETGRRLQRLGNLVVIAESPDCLVLWQALTTGLNGLLRFELLPAYTFTYQGFSDTKYVNEHAFRWSAGDVSMLRVRLEKGTAYRVTLTASIPRKVKAMQVLLNGQALTAFTFPGEWRWQEFMVQLPGAQVNDLNELAFRYVYLTPPENPRLEGRHGSLVAFESLTVEKLPAVR